MFASKASFILNNRALLWFGCCGFFGICLLNYIAQSRTSNIFGLFSEDEHAFGVAHVWVADWAPSDHRPDSGPIPYALCIVRHSSKFHPIPIPVDPSPFGRIWDYHRRYEANKLPFLTKKNRLYIIMNNP